MANQLEQQIFQEVMERIRARKEWESRQLAAVLTVSRFLKRAWHETVETTEIKIPFKGSLEDFSNFTSDIKNHHHPFITKDLVELTGENKLETYKNTFKRIAHQAGLDSQAISFKKIRCLSEDSPGFNLRISIKGSDLKKMRQEFGQTP